MIFANGKYLVIWTAGDEACEGQEGAVYGAFITLEAGGMQSLTVSKDGTGSGTVISIVPSGAIDCGATCDASFPQGTSVTLSASAATGSIFAGWSGEGCTGTGDCTVSMTQSRAVTATFNLGSSSHILTLKVLGSSGGTVTGPGIACGDTCSTSVASSTTVTLTRSAGAGGAFREWSGACTGTGLTCSVTMDAAKEVTAVFSKNFSDTNLTGVAIKAVHVTELRAAIDTLRSHCPNLPAFDWTDSTLAPRSTLVKRQHLLDLRTALDAAYTKAGKSHAPYAESITGGSTPIKGSHLTELRTHVRGLE
ncbi:MAG TPA: hypothetical protein VLT62_02060 [Candidatus Methylomirabilis sp.]|nr:hypothetical protein [Candidatus Methylomirabilis sp.]